MSMRARGLRLLLSLFVVLLACCMAHAHPMGNFSVNHYSKISMENDSIRIRYIMDLAEIPTFQELQQANISTNGLEPDSPAVAAFIAQRGVELGQGLALELNGHRVALRLVSKSVIFPPGAGGLPTMKMGFVYEAMIPGTLTEDERAHLALHFADNNYPGHAGWKEIVAQASVGSILTSSVPSVDRSGELSNYPTDLLTSPPQTLEANLTGALAAIHSIRADKAERLASNFGTKALHALAQGRISSNSRIVRGKRDESAPLATATGMLTASTQPSGVDLRPNRQQTPRNRFTELIEAQRLSAWFLFTAALIAIGLGGLHALEPGHGKTIVAAYLVGSRGTAYHALALGIIVTVSHTAGVFALGAITLYASRYIVPEQLYPWLGALSGLTIAGLGFYLLLRRLTGTATDHSHLPGTSSAHWMFWKRTDAGASESDAARDNLNSASSVSMAQLFTLGITGGIIPCPAALIVLLSAFALHRIGLGFFLIAAFSLGLASVLILFGMMMVYARRFMARLHVDGPITKRWLPVASSSFMTILGGILAVQALAAVHFNTHLFSKERLGPALFVTGLGLILGMRHSTDADHVVAISTIVTKQRSIRNAAFIGSVWGLGHTITIFVVGALIILFGVEIPPRLGLSMEFSVAVMLILLGAMNLTGVMRKVTVLLTPRTVTGAEVPMLSQAEGSKTRMEMCLDNSIRRFGLFQFLRPLVIGLVHGLAGSAAVALLVLSTIHSPAWATVYLLIFGAGTMLGMMCMTAAIAVPLAYTGDRFVKLGQYLGTASGMVSLCFGSFLVYQLGFIGGLFTSHPHWTPQ